MQFIDFCLFEIPEEGSNLSLGVWLENKTIYAEVFPDFTDEYFDYILRGDKTEITLK